MGRRGCGEGDAKHRQHTQDLAYLCRRLPGLQIHNEPDADACYARKLVLAEVTGLTDLLHQIADLGGCEGSCVVHNYSRSRKI